MGAAATKSKVELAKKCSRKTVLVEREEEPYLWIEIGEIHKVKSDSAAVT
jgi:hypothetical protein